MRHLRFATVLMFLSLLPFAAWAKTPPVVPEPLKPWVEWVLHGHEPAHWCAAQYHDEHHYRCAFPTGITLSLGRDGGRFDQTGRVLYESWVPLVGDDRSFPGLVTVNGVAGVVIEREGIPQVKVSEGLYTIQGTLQWTRPPEHLRIPADAGLVSLTVDGRTVDFPDIDEQGRLWLKDRERETPKIEDTLNLQTFRLIEDQIPPRVQLRLQMDVAGAPREILLGPAFSPDMLTPVSLESPLPARIEPDGRIRLQVKPGRWEATIHLRHLGPLSELVFQKPADGFWPSQEIWAFSAENNLRMVEIDGPPSIDPQQTALPEAWRSHPAYRLVSGGAFRLKETKRGDPHPAPDQLSLERDLWLRFDGKGYTIQDRVSGRKSTDWRLEMTPDIALGRVVVDGAEQFITRLKDSNKAGVELRRGILRLSADSEFHGEISRVPLAGWVHDFQKVTTRLFLPPGYRLLHATGMDDTPDTWWTDWTLLDLFVVLVFTFAVARLYSIPFAVVACVTLVLVYQEPGAPRWIWVAVLVGAALLKYVPEGKFKKSVRFYQFLAALGLVCVAVPFAVQQLRIGIYPQLEKPWHAMASLKPMAPASMATPMVQEERAGEAGFLDEAVTSGSPPPPAVALKRRDASKGGSVAAMARSYLTSPQVSQFDPSVVNQTGPGLPTWQWRTVLFHTGPSQAGQMLGLWVIGPTANLILAFVRVGLMIVLALGLFGIRYQRPAGWRFPKFSGGSALGVFFLLSALVAMSAPGMAAQIPSPEMFEELRSRLLEKEDCFPDCVDVSDAAISITRDALHIRMNVAGRMDMAVPLPGSPRFWLPQQIRKDGAPADAIYRTDSGLWILLPAGNHELELTGRLPELQTLQLPLPIKPHRVTVAAVGWTVDGVREDGTADSPIQFRRILEATADRDRVLESGVLPPFAQLERTLLLGLEWKVQNRLTRVGPVGAAIVLDIPLLAGESIITPGLTVKNSRMTVHLAPQSQETSWESVLSMTDAITLRHEQTHHWTELWRVDVSPVFHMEYTGIPVILHQQGDRWVPHWHPWPGEAVDLTLSRPSGVKGQTLTIDTSRMEVRPGQRATDTQLTLSVRSSQGGQHPIRIPADARLEEVRINGKVLPIRQEDRVVQLPIIPGTQEVILKWRSSQGISTGYDTPEVDLGLSSVNSHMDVYFPRNRWPLWFHGPRMGPAILFWSVMGVIVLAALGLARTRLTPLKFRHWLLLGVGMSQGPLMGTLWVVGWLMALDLKKRGDPNPQKNTYNWVQFGLILLTFLAVTALVTAISQGLLGHPDMNIVGNGSSAEIFRWYQDQNDPRLPQAFIVSVPMLYYRLAMLAWALWIAAYLIFLLKWGWGRFTDPVPWAHVPKPPKPARRRWGSPKTENLGDASQATEPSGSEENGGSVAPHGAPPKDPERP